MLTLGPLELENPLWEAYFNGYSMVYLNYL